jgi:MFS family permease
MTYNADNSVPYGENSGAPAPTPYGQNNGAPAQTNPGKTLGIVGLILGIVGFFLAFLGPIAGLIVSIIGLVKSRKAGQKNGLAVAGIIVSIVALIANIVVTIILISLAATFGGTAIEMVEQCESNPSGSVEFQGQTIPCDELLQGTN